MLRALPTVCSLAAIALTVPLSAQEVPRTASGKPDLSGHYDVSTLTPLQRPPEFGDNLYLTPQKAAELVEKEKELMEVADGESDPNREAPPVGGAAPVGSEDREALGAGNVGGYNAFWIDRGDEALTVDGEFRTSIITDPKNGRFPPMTPEAQQAMAERFKLFRPNDGTAWWVDLDGPGPYDGPESLPMSERCMLGFTGAAPTFPSLYNNYKKIVQGEDHVMILMEMVHDARVVRMGSEHPGPEVKKWLGDSIGWWEGDTLVVETTNFAPDSAGFFGGTENRRVVERFSPMGNGDLLYRFTVEDDTTWTEPWSGEYIWRSSPNKIYEYACHEGNYSMGGTLRGARLLESEASADR